MQKKEMKKLKKNTTNEENNPAKKILVDLVIIRVIPIIEKNETPITEMIKKKTQKVRKNIILKNGQKGLFSFLIY